MSILMNKILKKPHEDANSNLIKILSGRLKRLGREKCDAGELSLPCWTSEFFGLNNSSGFYSRLSLAQQKEIVIQCNDNLLLESYFIEKLGMAYCAKMSLASETVEAAQTYMLIGADEATHLRWLTPYVPASKRTSPIGVFLDYLTTLVEHADTTCLIFLLQIILEGWGIKHYQRLADSCSNTKLKSILGYCQESSVNATQALLDQPFINHIFPVQNYIVPANRTNMRQHR